MDLEVHEVFGLQLGAVGSPGHDHTERSPRWEEPEEAGEPNGPLVQFDLSRVPIVESHLESAHVIRDDPAQQTIAGSDPKKSIDAVRCVPSFKCVGTPPPPNASSLPSMNTNSEPTGPCSHHFASGPGAVMAAWIRQGTMSTVPQATSSGGRA
jgi:hypothetical protein